MVQVQVFGVGGVQGCKKHTHTPFDRNLQSCTELHPILRVLYLEYLEAQGELSKHCRGLKN